MDEIAQERAAGTLDAHVDAQIRRLTRRSFATGAVAALAAGSATTWLATRATDGGIPWPLRKMLEFNERLAQSTFSAERLAPEFPIDRCGEPRVNGHVGLESPVAADDWVVHVVGRTNRHIPLSAIKELPAREMATELKCVEGWSRIVHWKGVRLADFLDKFGAPADYVGLSTPFEAHGAHGRMNRYYVGFDRPSAVHPQTLLCFEMNGQPLAEAHGAPLRLVSAVKYGYKCIKRVGLIELSNERPADYWAERGYDWYAGH